MPTTPDAARVIRTGDQSADQSADRAGEQLGQAVAGLVIAHLHAMEAGYADGYEREGYVANYCPMPERFAYIPDVFAQVPVLTDAYLREFAQGQLAYRADHLAAYGSCPLPV